MGRVALLAFVVVVVFLALHVGGGTVDGMGVAGPNAPRGGGHDVVAEPSASLRVR